MSYSFTLRAASKAAAKAAVAAKLDEIVTQQPVHAKDRAEALATAETFIDVLPDNEQKDVSVSMNGYVTGQWSGADLPSLSGVCIGFNASLVDKEAPKTA